MKQIVSIKDFQCENLTILKCYIREEVTILQEKGYEVEIQYSAVDKLNYTALVIAYRQIK